MDFLQQFQQIHIPKVVLEETGNLSQNLQNVTVITLGQEEIRKTTEMLQAFKLQEGELHALHLARQLKAVFLTDDLEAREAAIFLGLEVHGTVGIIAFAYHKNLISKQEAQMAINKLYTESSLYLTRFIVEEALRLLLP